MNEGKGEIEKEGVGDRQRGGVCVGSSSSSSSARESSLLSLSLPITSSLPFAADKNSLYFPGCHRSCPK
jgi:hypothetical protein